MTFLEKIILATVWRTWRPREHEEEAAGGFMKLMGVKGIEFIGFSFHLMWEDSGKGLEWVPGFCIS